MWAPDYPRWRSLDTSAIRSARHLPVRLALSSGRGARLALDPVGLQTAMGARERVFGTGALRHLLLQPVQKGSVDGTKARNDAGARDQQAAVGSPSPV